MPWPRPLLHLASRGRWVLGVGALAVGARLTLSPAPAHDAAEVARRLGQSVGGTVAPDGYVWELREHPILDSAWGRHVLFVAQRGQGSDLFRARARLSMTGRVVSIARVVNLSNTPDDSDTNLMVQGRVAVTEIRDAGGVRGIRALDLAGEGDALAHGSRWSAAWTGLTSWLRTDSAEGVRVMEASFDKPLTKLDYRIAKEHVVLALGEEATPASVGVYTARVNIDGADVYGMRAHVLRHPDESVARSAPRQLAELGLPRLAELAHGLARRLVTRPEPADRAWDAAPIAASGSGWPPPGFPTHASAGSRSDGLLRAASSIALPGAPPAMLEAIAKPANTPPDAYVRLTLLDTRQLDLVAVPGQRSPEVRSGPSGAGALPHTRGVVAVFNGASPGARLASSGMIVRGRVLAPVTDGAPTLLLDPQRGARLGAWSGLDLADAQASLRQSTADPRDDRLAERSALCLTSGGHLAYAYAAGLRASELRAYLAEASCTHVFPLAGSPGPVGFAYVNAGADEELSLAPADARMSFPPPGFAQGSRDDFFAVVLRSADPPASSASLDWLVADGRQPEPAWMPGFAVAERTRLGVEVRVTRLAPERFAFKLRAGDDEIVRSGTTSLPKDLEPTDAPLLTIGLGIGTRKQPRGLGIDGVTGLFFRAQQDAVLVLEAEATRLSLLPAKGYELPPGASATELRMTADDGALRADGIGLGPRRRRAALCIADDGAVLVATGTFDSDEATTTVLLDAGCRRVAALDRGVRAPGVLERATAEAAPPSRHPTTTLYALDVPMRGRASALP